MSLLEFATWLQSTPFSVAIQSASWVVPTLQSLHILMIGVVFVSILFALAAFGVFQWAEDNGRSLEEARTLVVNTIVVLEVFYLFSVRYLHATSLTWKGLLGTRTVLIGFGAVGQGSHSPAETVDLTSFDRQIKRTALLISRLSRR